MNKIGILIDNLYASQLAYYVAHNVNQHLSKDWLTNFIIFVKDLVIPVLAPECAVMRWEELWGFEGKIISTTLEGTQKAVHTPGPTEIAYYAYDLDWTRLSGIPSYENLREVYQNKDIKLITRNDEYKKFIEWSWNRKVDGIAEDFDLKKILPVIGVYNENQVSNK
jgi:hypothetical protein